MAEALDEQTTKELLIWIDSIELSRPKKNINRDFADGVLVAEVIHSYFPQRVEKHNYIPSSGRQGKLTNWATLNRKVLSKFGFTVPQDVIENIIAAKPNYVEIFLNGLKRIIEAEKNKDFTEQYYVTYQAPETVVPSSFPKNSNRSNPIPGTKSNRSKPPPKKTPEPSLEATIQAGIPLSQLNLHLLDTDTKLILAEKEQALLASHETIKILQMKTHRLEQLLSLKEKRIEELKRKLLDE